MDYPSQVMDLAFIAQDFASITWNSFIQELIVGVYKNVPC